LDLQPVVQVRSLMIRGGTSAERMTITGIKCCSRNECNS
jgi:hypothetical protein